MHFGEFSALEVLAATAVQQSEPTAATSSSANASSASGNNAAVAASTSNADQTATEEDDDDVVRETKEGEVIAGSDERVEEKEERSTDSTMVAPLVTDAGNSKPLALQSPLIASSVRGSTRISSGDSTSSLTKIVIPNKDGKSSKTLTVLKMKGGIKLQGQGMEHTYAFVGQTDGGATKTGKMPEDDEGYCSRSSLDSPGQSSRTDSDAFEQEASTFDSQKSPVIRGGPMSPPPPPRVTSPRPKPTRTGMMAPPSIKTQPAPKTGASTDNKTKTSSVNNSVLKPPVAPQSKENELCSNQVKTDSSSSSSNAPTSSLSSSTSPTTSCTPTPLTSVAATPSAAEPTKTEPTVSVPKEAKSDLKTVSSTESTTVTMKEEVVEAVEPEEVIDVTTFTAPVDQSLVLVTTAATLPSTTSLPTTAQSTSSLPSTITVQLPRVKQLSSVPTSSSSLPSVVSVPSSSIATVAANSTKSVALTRQIIDSSAKRVPFIINPSIGHKVANQSGQVTYLLVPPQAAATVKGANGSGTGGLVLSQLGTKNQYIIQDDLPPSTKLANGTGVELGPRLAIADNKRLVMNTNKTAAPTHAKPVSLLSKPVKPSGAVLCIDANTGRPMFRANSPSQLGIFASKVTPVSSSLSVSSSSSSQLSTSSSASSLLSSSSPTSVTASSASTNSSTLNSLENPDKQINIKISGSKVIDMANLQEITPGTVGKKQAACIGNLGSISLTKIDNASPVSPRTVSPLSRTVSPLSLSAASSFSPIGSVAAGSRSHTPLSMGGGDTMSLFSPTELESPNLAATTHSNGKSNMSARTCHTYVKRKNSASSAADVAQKGGGVDIGGMRLHPLIDHDYCMFTEFSAEIQSSIIATTESKLKTERKYSKKTKAARCTKVLRTPPPEKAPSRKKRKYTRRIPLEKLRQQRSVESTTLSIPSPSSVDSMDIGSPESGLSSPTPLTPLKPESPGPKAVVSDTKLASKGKSPSKRRDGRNYVKITGSYQDEFVYFATKKTSGRPRKYHDSVASQASTESTDGGPQPPQQPTPATVAGVNVFDWYRDLSNTDKSSKFGMDSDIKVESEDTPVSTSEIPQHDSEVVDLVMEMANDSTSYSQANLESFNSFVDSHSMQSETVITTPSDEMKPLLGSDMETNLTTPIKTENIEEDIKPKVEVDTAPGTPVVHDQPINEHPVIDEAMMAEVQDMLSSMGEEDLKILTQNLSSEAVHETPVKSEPSDHHSLNPFLGSYNTDCVDPAHSSTGAFDLDDIAHSDLLPINEPTTVKLEKESGSTLNMLFPDMCRSSAESPLKQLTDIEKHEQSTTPDNFSEKLDRSELFPDITTPSTSVPQPQQPQSIPPAVSGGVPLAPPPTPTLPGNASPPELTTVHMYWNDLPGLMLNGRQHVRLVDIHKQMLPAKDTGILKKRCQMMQLKLVNCSELERDFLVRYASAAKSKSTVLVSKEDATALVSFYVEPRPRAPRHMSASYADDAADPIGAPLDDAQLAGPKSELGGKLKLKMKLKAEEIKQEEGSLDEHAVSPPASTGGKTRRPGNTNPRRRPSSISSSPLDDDDAKRSGRTRNKKVNYAALHSGGYEDGPKLSMEFGESELVITEHSQSSTASTMSTDQNEWVETVEIEKLIEKRRAQGGQLSKVDNEKLIYWRDQIKLRIKEKNNELQEKKKSRKKTVSVSDIVEEKAVETTDSVDEVATSEFIEVVSPGPPSDLLISEGCTESSTQTPVVEHVNIDDPEEAHVVEAPSKVVSEQEMPAITVHHRDNTSRTSQQRSRWQEGMLKLSQYSSRDSPCITCSTCTETFSVKKFIKHLHHQNKVDELCEVTLVQKLEPKCPAPMLTWQIWEQFEKRQAQFEEIAFREKQILKLQRQEQNAANRPAQRLSGRARKRKQLHPMESYVYANNPNKRARYDLDTMNQTTEHSASENKERITPKDTVNVEKVR